MRNYFDVNESENTAFQTLGDAAKAVLQEKFIVVLKKKLKSVTFQVQKLEKEGQTEPKTDSWKEIKTRTEVMKQRREKRQKNVSKPKLVLQSCQQNDRPLARPT